MPRMLFVLLALNIGCLAASDGKVAPTDACSVVFANQIGTAHVIECDEVEPIP